MHPKHNPELGMPGHEAEWAEQQDYWKDEARKAALEQGMSEALWSMRALDAVPHLILARTGHMPFRLPLSVPIQGTRLTPAQAAAMPSTVIVQAKSWINNGGSAFYCFTQCEPWWGGPTGFLADDLPTICVAFLYQAARLDHSLRGAGAGLGSVAVTQTLVDNELYNDWLLYCAEHRKEVDALHADVERLATELNAARMKVKQHKALNWPDYRAAHNKA